MKSIARTGALRKFVLVTGVAAALLLGTGTTAAADDRGQNNFAIAENHRDFSTLIRTSMRIVYVSGDVTAINAADAEASCVHCQTAAVAIEAIIVIGYPSTFAPQNYAIALNTNCSFCDTGAYAGQFDLQYARPVQLTERGQEQVEALRDQLNELRHSALSSMAIVIQASAIRQQLEAVLKQNLVPVDGEDDQPLQRDRSASRSA
ncbi:MAG TPA: hypothetical protein VJT14_02620 [Candidatus Dormibacteraeota bacterium]|nr:hypothetical protein [Candidatus Dormibacteraeota bacterium]